ncbi:MAG: Protein translocase subunit SecA [Parcubacteria group bacterium GW2011_GWA2_51_10]|nr:MAG: Protein translocase subunit SecA [Parcubacteria group bacterium GW2011_GWA2_51_10]
MSFLKSIFGDENVAALKRTAHIVAECAALEESVRALSLDALRQKTAELRAKLTDGATLDELAAEAFAVVREASRRTLGERHFDVQLIGGLILHNGDIAEMRTGEGKTLVATLPAYLNALTGRGVHIVTVNDYLSRRDAVWMGQIYHALGMSVGVINHETSYVYDPSFAKEKEDDADRTRDALGSFKVVHEYLRPCTRRESYAADITYGTNNEFGFDYLRDNIEYDSKNLRQWRGGLVSLASLEHRRSGPEQDEARLHSPELRRSDGGYHYAIVDEIDSILIDEARTPLIISAPVADAERLYERFTAIARALVPDVDYTVDEKHKQIALSDSGIEKAQKELGVENIYTEAGIKYVHHLETAVRAKALYEKDKDYVIKNGEVVIVDEFTGRLQPGRRWSEGLHQAIESKEGVTVQQESRTFASITFQNYFRLYGKLAGMTGTAITSSEEFYKVYGLNTVSVPTNKPSQRKDHEDLIFQSENGKYKAVARKVKDLQQKGQPVLVGTASVEKNELLSAHFKQEGIPHEVLNAKNHEREGEIIAQAGRFGAVTIATNMAGRGVDIKLGGNPSTPEEYDAVKKTGGLFVLGTERHEARRIDNQLRGRSGRQGDPGETEFFVSLEDSLMRIFASDMIKRVMGTFKIPEDEPIYNSMITKALEKAQTRIEELNFDARKHVLAYDDVLNIQRQSIYARRRALLTGDADAVAAELTKIGESDPEFEQAVAKKKTEFGDEFYTVMRRFLLQTTDFLWVEHLEAMEYLRSSVNLRAYGQRDPLVEYKKEGLKLFQSMEENYRLQVIHILPNLGAPTPMGRGPDRSVGVIHSAARSVAASPPVPSASKIGRNDRIIITDGAEKREMKYKKAESLLATGKWRVVGS